MSDFRGEVEQIHRILETHRPVALRLPKHRWEVEGAKKTAAAFATGGVWKSFGKEKPVLGDLTPSPEEKLRRV